MPKRIPISVAKRIAKETKNQQIILLAWDGERTHVVTYGTTLQDCDMAAEVGNKIKKMFNWPKELQSQPSRVKRLQKQIKETKECLKELFKTAIVGGRPQVELIARIEQQLTRG